MNYNQQSKMKDYEITIVMQVQASDAISEDEVLAEVLQHLPNTPALLNADKDIALNDVYKSIICLNELSDGSHDGFERFDEMLNFLKRENAHSEYVCEQLRKYAEADGMKPEDYETKPKQKPQRQSKPTIKDVASVWQKCTVTDNILHLPSEQLDRPVYEQVKAQLQAVGGKWKGGKTSGFVFPETTDANDVLSQLISGKDYQQQKKDFQFYATPAAVADEVAKHLESIPDNVKILEPSAGQGALIKAVQRINGNVNFDVFEAMEDNKKALQKMQNVNIVGTDFLQSDLSVKYQYIIANPPFTKNQDITHVMRMLEHLKEGGKLVAIMSPHFTHSEDKKSKEFRQLLQDVGAEVHEIDEGAFAESGTQIRTYFVVMSKETIKSNALF